MVQPETRSFVSVLRSPVTPFDRGKTIAKSANFTKNGNCFVAQLAPFRFVWESRNKEGEFFWQRKVWTHCEFQRHNGDHLRRERREVWREKRKLQIFGKGKRKLIANCANFGKGKCKLVANFNETMMTSLPSLSLSLSLSLTERTSHTIWSASALPINTRFSH